MRLETTTPRIVPISNMGTISSIKKPTIHIVHILDGSGSMGESGSFNTKFTNAKQGMLEEIDLLKANTEVNYLYSIVEFSSNSKIVKVADSLPVTSDFNLKVLPFFNPDGLTALYDAVGLTLRSLLFENKSDVKVLVKIFTDGGENDSRHFSSQAVKNVIREAEIKGFVITFVGTEYDTMNMIKTLDLKKDNTFSYNGTASGLKQAYNVANIATMAYSKAIVRGEETRGFFNNNN
jgi:hypothetical protein